MTEIKQISVSLLESNTGQLKGLPKNPRLIKDERYKKLVKSIKDLPEMMDLRPLLVYAMGKKYVIIGGNMRFKALLELKWESIPCVVIPAKTAVKTLKEIAIKDNVSFGSDSWEDIKTDWNIAELEEWGMEVMIKDKAELTMEDEVHSVDKIKTTIKLGDIIEIGKHRLVCGDSSDEKTLKQLMGGLIASLVFTDPPYRCSTNVGTADVIGKMAGKTGRAIKFISEFDPNKFLETLPKVFEKAKMNSYIFCNKDLVPDYLNWGVANGYNFNILFWKKPNAIPMGGNHRPDVEYLLLFRKNAHWNNSVKGLSYSKCLEFSRETSTPHPTMKPIGLIANEVQISSPKGGVVVDFFGGSGSTMVACEQVGRRAFLAELEPKYCQLTIDRMQNLNPSIAVKVNGKPYKSAK